MIRSSAILTIALLAGCSNAHDQHVVDPAASATDTVQRATPRVERSKDSARHVAHAPDTIAIPARTRAIINGLKRGDLRTKAWNGWKVEYGSDARSGDMSYRCTAQDTQRELEVFALYPGNAGPKAVDREFFSHGRPLQRVTVDNDLFTTQDTMHVHIVYNEEGTVDFRRPVGDTHYLLIYSTPMNWVGRMVSEWRFVQLVAFDEGRIYELALPNEPA